MSIIICNNIIICQIEDTFKSLTVILNVTLLQVSAFHRETYILNIYNEIRQGICNLFQFFVIAQKTAFPILLISLD